MTLEEFMQTTYYNGKSEKESIYENYNNSTHNIPIYDLEPANINKNNQHDYEKAELLYRTKLSQESFQTFLENYHNEMKQSLRMMNDKIDKYAKVLEDLSDLTKKIPQMLVKLKNEKVPRVFIMIPDQKDWKKPATWFSKPFRLLFVCEYKNQWHVPEQEGYKVLDIPQFIKKYGPWINLCLQTLCSVLRALTSNVFPESVAHILTSVFNINNSYNLDLIQYFQEIIDTVDIGVKTMPDEDPDFVPLSNEIHSHYRMINASGLHQLEKFLDTQECASHFGGLIQCVDDKTQEVVWLCEEHSIEYKPVSSPLYSPQLLSPSLRSLNISPPGSVSPPTIFVESTTTTRKWDYSDFDKRDSLDPYLALEYQTTYYNGKSEKESIYENYNNSTHNIPIYDLEPANINKNNQHDYEKAELLYRTKLSQESFQTFLENYHNEMKQSLRMMNDKIDKYAKVLEDLSDLTKKIPQMLVKLKNEKVPRVFIMIPDQKDWKKPATWFSKPFRLLFVCEYKNQWHVPEQEGYKVLDIPQFIKKYGPWINLCLQTLCSVLRALTSNVFPESVAHILTSVFNINNSYNLDLIQYFQEIIDTVDIGVKTMPDEDPDFVPLSNEIHSHYRMINASGLHQLEKFLDTQECASHFGGLIQCVDDKTQEVVWLCEEHSIEYKPVSSPLYSPQLLSPSLRSLNISPPGSVSPPTIFVESTTTTRKWDYSDFDKRDSLDPYLALEYYLKKASTSLYSLFNVNRTLLCCKRY
ncbi:unnamed protein product [Rhizophagus irregularis]|nr:unnamed protein product [Rhizophagus irregularis]